jgi:hypothetical protein
MNRPLLSLELPLDADPSPGIEDADRSAAGPVAYRVTEYPATERFAALFGDRFDCRADHWPPEGWSLDRWAADVPSLAPGGSLESVVRLRTHHLAKGHSPASDTEHGPTFFTLGAEHFLMLARNARSAETVRSHRIAAIAMLVALVDRDDFIAAQAGQDNHREETEHA